MKEIKAYIKPLKLSEITLALHKVEGLAGLTVVDARGFGRGRAKESPQRIVQDAADYLPCVRIEIICKDDLVEEIVTTIERVAHTGLKGDGKIYVASVEQAVRISTGERGKEAV